MSSGFTFYGSSRLLSIWEEKLKTGFRTFENVRVMSVYVDDSVSFIEKRVGEVTLLSDVFGVKFVFVGKFLCHILNFFIKI